MTLREFAGQHKTANYFFEGGSNSPGPVSMVMMRVWYTGLREHSGGIAGKWKVRPLFSKMGFYVQSEL